MNIKLTKQEKDILLAFKADVCERSNEVDAEEEQDWFGISLGYFIAKGVKPERAHLMSVHVRYDLQYFDGTGEELQ